MIAIPADTKRGMNVRVISIALGLLVYGRERMCSRLVAVLTLGSALAIGGCGESAPTSGPENVLIVRGGGLFDGTGDDVVPNPGIVIADGRFQSISAEAAQQALEGGGTLIELEDDQVVIPGLFDLHAHYAVDLRGEGRIDETDVYPILFLANGVTSTFPAGEVQPEKMRQLRLSIEAGEEVGPRLFNSGPYYGSARPDWDPDITPDSIRAEVDYWVAQGARGFKAKGITGPHLQALIERAHHHGLTVTGHLGSGYRESVNPRDAIAMGIDRIEHFMGGDAMTADRSAYASLVEMTPDMPEFERIARLYIGEGVNFDGTISAYGYYGERDAEVYDYFHDEMKYLTPYARELVESNLPRRVNDQFEQIYWVKRQLIRKFWEMGGGHLITLGTDHPSWGEYFSGFSVHRELHAFVLAGIPPADVLRFATINAARALGVADELGTIEPGKRADLVIVRGNPIADIRSTRDVRLVMKDGETYDPATLLQSVEGRLGPTGPEDLDEW